MENYTAQLTRTIERFADSAPASESVEIMVSCALTPEHGSSVWIEAIPDAAEGSRVDALLSELRAIPAPMVQEGPVAFAFYRRVHCPTATSTVLKPFGFLLSKIENRGFDHVLSNAAHAMHSDEAAAKESWLQTLRQLLKGWFTKTPKPDVNQQETKYADWNRWIETLEENFDMTVQHELESEDQQQLQTAGRLVWLAASCSEKQDWKGAISRYTSALEMLPGNAPLLARRARVFRMAGNRQSSLADWNQAIAIAPYDPWLFYHRSEIFADLEAWPKAEEDLDAAIELSPIEPTFLFARSQIRFNRDSLSGVRDDLDRAIQLDPNNGHSLARLGWLLQSEEERDLDLAIEYLTRSIEVMPGHAEPVFQRALAYASQNKLELALQDCNTIIARHPTHGAAYGIRGRVLQVQGEFEEAIEACSKSIELGWKASIARLARGFAYAATGELDLALQDCDEVDELDPDNPLCCQLRGMLSFHRGELETAMQAFAKARDLVPDWTEPREQLAMLHRINQNPKAAVEEQTALVRQQPECASHYVNRAFAYAQLSDFDRARCDYDHAVNLEPENEQILYLRGCYSLDRGLLEAALADFDKALAIAGEHDESRARRAGILLQLKRPQEAIVEYEKLIAKYPDDLEAYSGHAFASQLIGNDQAAEDDFDQMRRLAPENEIGTTVRSMLGKARSLEQEERYAEAIEVAAEIIDLAPGEAVGYEVRAWMQWCDEQFVEAVDDYTRLLELTEEHPNALNGRGHIQAEMGDWRLALDDLDRAIEIGRKKGKTRLLAYALNGRALALAGIGQSAESVRDYKESVSLCPDNAWVHYNRGIVLLQQGETEEANRMLQQAIECENPVLPKRKRLRAIHLLDNTA
ncbi:MAG: tetratricopeptide repeat protein [Rubripirellula sp.]|nr:tetratricopeptide repeat protein [Rubripirellula sp.]